MNRRDLLRRAALVPLAAAVSRFPDVAAGPRVPDPAPARETITVTVGDTYVPHTYDSIRLDGDRSWVVGVDGDTFTVIRNPFPAAPISA